MLQKEFLEFAEAVRKKKLPAVISAAVSVINIWLVGQMEPWTETCPSSLRIAAGVAGFLCALFFTGKLFYAEDGRRKRCAAAAGTLMAAAYVLGCRLRQDGTVLRSVEELPGFLFSVVFLSVLAAAGCFPWIGRESSKKERKGGGRSCAEGISGGALFLGYLGMILLCWLPVFLAYYPSVFAYDAEGQLYQVISHDYSTHHPLLHTLFLGAFFRLGGWLGSYSAGMAVHSVVQMLLMAAVFSYTLLILYKEGVKRSLRLLLLVFYALFPTNSVLALSTTKDVLFAALVLCYVLELYRLCRRKTDTAEKKETRRQKFFCALPLVLIGVTMLLFRNNALYALLASAPFAAAILKKVRRSERKRYLWSTLCTLVLFAAAAIGLKALLGAQSGSPREMLSVPLQQIARTRVYHEEEIEPQMRTELDRYLSSEWVITAYQPHLADPVKNRTVIHDQPLGLIRCWLQLGVQFPQTYMDAFLDNSVGLWFLEDVSHAEIYGKGTESGFGYLSTDNRAMPAGCEIIEDSKLPGLRRAMEEIVSENRYQELPVVSVVFAPAFYWWLLVLYAADAVYRRRWERLVPVSFLTAYYLTLLLSPAVLVRYMYPLMISVPPLLLLGSIPDEADDGFSEQCQSTPAGLHDAE